MNFGAFAGGFSSGLDQGMKTGKNLRELIKEGKLQDLREQGMAEAEATRARSVADMIKDGGAAERPTSGPVETKPAVAAETPAVAEPTGAVATPVPPQPGNPYDPGDTRTDPKPVAASPTPTVAGQPVMPPSVSTQAPAAPAPATATAPTAASPAATAPAAVAPAQPAAPATAIQASPTAQPGPVTPQAIAAAGTSVTPKSTGRFTVNGQGYDTREEAQAAAEKSAPSATDLFIKNTVPKISQSYLMAGDPAKAKEWDTWAEAGKNKRAIKDWAAAFTAPDMDTAVSKFGKYYTDHINDDVDYTGHKMLTKADGTQVAVVTMKDKKTGKSTEMELTREKMLALGGANNPQKLFEQETAKQTAADKFKFEQKIKNDERRQTNADTIARDDRKGDREDTRWAARDRALDGRAGAGVNAKIDAQVSALRDAGYPDDEIKRMMPAIIGAGDHKKTTDPTERRALVFDGLSKTDTTFSRKTPELQNKQVDDAMKVIYRDEAKPAAPAPAPAPASDASKIYRDNQTGERFRVIDGKRVPIGAPPTAGGPPAKPAGPAAGMPARGATGTW